MAGPNNPGELVQSNTPQFDVPYISWYVIRFPPWPGYGFMNGFVFPVIMKLDFQTIKIDSAGFIDPDAVAAAAANNSLPFGVPPEMSSGRGRPWIVFIQWRKIAEGGGQRGQEAGIDGIVRLLLIGGLAVLGYLTFRSFTTSVTKIQKLGTSTVFAPGFVIAALVIVAIVWGKR